MVTLFYIRNVDAYYANMVSGPLIVEVILNWFLQFVMGVLQCGSKGGCFSRQQSQV